jgi:RpiR family transcriptional regulator, carbohydrate utilization regulator
MPGRSPERRPRKEAAATPGSTMARLAAVRDGLSPVARRIADFILGNREKVIHMSITEVAERVRVSEGSIIGLCQQLDLKGFQGLKIDLAQGLLEPIKLIHEDLERDDDVATIVNKVFQSDIQALQDTLAVLDRKAVAQAIDIILAALWVEIYGIGSAAPVALDAYHRMIRLGLNCKVVTDSHAQAVSASQLKPGVAVLTISHSGSTIETVAATRLAKEAGARTICITNVGKSPIQAHADVVLYTAAKETKFRTEAMTSRIAELAIVDALNAGIALANYERSLKTIRRTFEVLSTKRL